MCLISQSEQTTQLEQIWGIDGLSTENNERKAWRVLVNETGEQIGDGELATHITDNSQGDQIAHFLDGTEGVVPGIGETRAGRNFLFTDSTFKTEGWKKGRK